MDGSLVNSSRGRGRFSIELNKTDCHLIDEFADLLAVKSSISSRTRNTNFKEDYESYSLIIFNKDFRKELESYGFPSGKKSNKIKIPNCGMSVKDFWRGVIDADGSLGLTSQNFPFISLTTKSEHIKNEFIDLIETITGKKKNVNRNKRDDIYNIMLTKESAVALIKYLYEGSEIYLKRKFAKAVDIIKWERPKGSGVFSKWTESELDFIQNNTINDSVKKLKRTKMAILAKLANI